MRLEEQYKSILLKIIKKYVPHSTVYLFGSRARKDSKPGSDIDLAINTGNKLPLETISKIQEKIEKTEIPIFVDITDYATAPLYLKKQIDTEGIIWSD